MSRYLLDTDALINYSKGREPATSRIQHLIDQGDELGVCAVNVAEFASGIPSDQISLWNPFLSEFSYWDISRETAALAGAFRHTLARRGTRLQLPDAIVAAVAATLGATILTDNVKHFLPISHVRVRPLRS